MTLAPFTARCCDADFDAGSIAAHFKAAHPRGVMLRNWKGTPTLYAGPADMGSGYRVPKRWAPSPLTPFEKDWLGMTVELPDGRIGQVWSACADRYRGNVAVVAPTVDGPNELVLTHTETLRKIASWREAAEEVALFGEEVAA